MTRWLFLLMLTGCMANNGLGSLAESQDNIWNLSRISIGMTESEVLQVMHQPYKKKKFDHGEDRYQVWFYVTRPVGLDQSRLVRQNLTPLTFENGVLLGWGFDFYHHVIQELDKSSIQEKPVLHKSHEDKSLEKAIQDLQKPLTTQAEKPTSPPPQEEEDAEEEEDKPFDDRGRKMIQEADDQNLDFW